MIDGISEAQDVQEEQDLDARLATVGAVYTDGLTLIFDGQEAATEKHYKCNTSVTFKAGDRVKVARISGSYVVEYVVGAPGSGGGGGSGVSELVNGDYKLSLSSAGYLVPTGAIKLGTSANKFDSIFAGGINSGGANYIGFYNQAYSMQATAIYKTITSANQIYALQAVMDRLIAVGIFK